MKKNIPCIIIILILIFETVYLYNLTSEFKTVLNNNSITTELIDSLDNEVIKLRAYRDSVENKIDTVKTQIVYIKEKYEKEYNTIVNQSLADDIEFFTNYLSESFE